MTDAFEDFLVAALREALGLSARELVQGAHGHPLFLDHEREVSLEPDLSIWRAGVPVFVGDAKYKRIRPSGDPNADVSQALAYAVATGPDRATLIYAAGEGEPMAHTVVDIGKQIEVVARDLHGSPDEILGEVTALAARVRQQVPGLASEAA